MLVCIHRQMRLPYFDTRDQAFERAQALAEDHQAVERVGDVGLILRLDDPHHHVLVTYDNQEGHMLDLDIVEDTTGEVAHLLQIKDELLSRFRALPPEHQATILLVCLRDVINGTMGEWFVNALLTLHQPRLEFTSSDQPPFPSVTYAHLSELAITNRDLASITQDDLIDLQTQMRTHYVEDLFLDELAAHTEDLLTEKRRRQGKQKGNSS